MEPLWPTLAIPPLRFFFFETLEVNFLVLPYRSFHLPTLYDWHKFRPALYERLLFSLKKNNKFKKSKKVERRVAWKVDDLPIYDFCRNSQLQHMNFEIRISNKILMMMIIYFIINWINELDRKPTWIDDVWCASIHETSLKINSSTSWTELEFDFDLFICPSFSLSQKMTS